MTKATSLSVSPFNNSTQIQKIDDVVAAEQGEAKFVIGLGASAGGLEALERFFRKAPTESGGAFIVVMHLARNFRSVLSELLARQTPMPVRAVADRMEIAANVVYVIQPGTEIQVEGTHFRVNPRPVASYNGRLSSIDVLLRSVATSWGDRGIGVILSGSGSDGSQGVIAVHAAGGTAFAQSPESAKFDSMPIAAIATNCISGVDSPENLARLACESVASGRLALSGARNAIDVEAFKTILASVMGASHLDPAQYTRSMFERRILRRMKEREVSSLTQYAETVRSHRDEARALSEALLIGVTDFFRDEAAFAAMGRLVTVELVRRAFEEKKPVRVWVAGCATGEEAYSIAMLLAEAAHDVPAQVDFQVFATDVHKGHLAHAARGEYAPERMVNVSEARRREFFTRNYNGMWQVAPSLRKTVVFAPHDMLSDPPFTRLDLVVCRNVIIYFSVEAQQRVLSSFAFGLLEGGYLFLGASETVGAQREAFEFVDARRRIFKRTRARSRGSFLARSPELTDRGPSFAPSYGMRRSAKQREAALQPVYAAMLKEFAPASLLVSSERELLHTFGEARSYLRPAEGIARSDVTEMCDPALKTPIAAGIERAMRDRTALTFSHVELQSFPEPGRMVDVVIRPLLIDDNTTFILISFTEVENKPLPVPLQTVEPYSRVAELEIEILRVREALQATIEEIETTNEQLMASNEQLLSSNEELQSTNEELSSLNEELHSVNAEHFRQNTELVRLTRDFDALLRESEIGVLFLDEKLCIRRFTRLIGEVFGFAEADVGRSLRTFRTPFIDLDLEGLLLRSLRSGVPETAEAQDETMRAWLLRVARYSDKKGVVLSVVRSGGANEHSAEDRERIFIESAPFVGDALIVADPETGHLRYANGRAQLMFGVAAAPDENFEISRLTPEWGTPSWIRWLASVQAGVSAQRSDVSVIDAGGVLNHVDIRATLMRDNNRSSVVIRFIESVGNADNAAALRELRERARSFAVSNRELERFASVVAHDLRAPLRHLGQFAEFLQSEIGDAANSKTLHYLQVIQTSASNMTAMVERMLDYARIGIGAPRLGPIDLSSCFNEAWKLLEQDAASADIDAQFGAKSWVKGDRILLVRLFQNLLQNALKFRKPENRPQIKLRTSTEGKTLVLVFEDNGVGVDPERAPNIFGLYERGHSDAEFPGHGIGLAICRRICEAHGGSIALDLAHREGARFVIRLARTRAGRKRVSQR